MNESDVRELLDELAGGVEGRDLAEQAWSAARRRRARRRRFAVASVVAATAVVVALVAWPGGLRDGRPARIPGSPAPAVTPTPARDGVIAAPARADEALLPQLDGVLPATLDPGRATTPLSAAPVQRAVALLQRWGDGASVPPVVVVGADGASRVLDGVRLQPVPDGAGNIGTPLRPGSLSPDGRSAAFPQHGSVVVVDLTTAAVQRWPLPGYNGDVVWMPDDGHVLVARDSGAALLDTRSGAVSPVAGTTGAGVVYLDGGGWVDLQDAGGAAGTMTVHAVDGSVSPAVPVAGVGQWWGQGHAWHDRVARGGFGAGVLSDGFSTADPQVIAVVDVGQRQREALLAFDWPGRSKGCCAVLGWSDAGMLLFTSVGDGPTRILGWDLGSGRLYRVSEVTPGTVASIAVPR